MNQGELQKLQQDEDQFWLAHQYHNVKGENKAAYDEAIRRKREEQLEAQLNSAVERGEMPALQAKQKKMVKTASLRPKRGNTFFGKRNEEQQHKRK